MNTPRRWRCKNCHEITPDPELLTAANPFCADEELTGCPACKNVGEFSLLCDDPECQREATCGWPTGDERRYRHTCYEHFPQGSRKRELR